jgi:2-hydroxychromene-2-carboxylate isomerase
MRAATWAAGRGAGEAFARTAFRMAFAEGRDITAPEELSALGGRMGLDGRELLDATGSQEVKDLLRERTEEAWELGVRGVPSLLVEGEVFFGDERLESAAARLRG